MQAEAFPVAPFQSRLFDKGAETAFGNEHAARKDIGLDKIGTRRIAIENRVIDSRLSREGDVTRRRRACSRCERRFTTYERVEEILPLIVKKDGRREAYDRLKVVNGLRKACEKRPVSMAAIEETADRIERFLQNIGDKEISSAVIGEEVMRQLYELDKVAYVRFASVYR